ncbi:MAG: tyrosine-type recombinase/integrase [Candidatus Onthovivens sp.]|nr:tyrosine-type recombinase/integrase [Candidatus Onthovivens sp.]
MANKRANGEGSGGWVTRNGIKYWRIQIPLGFDPLTGKLKRKVIYGKTQKEAKEKLKEYLKTNNINSDNSLLGNFFNDWLWNIKRDSIKPSTFEKWEGIYRNYIKPLPGLNNKKLTELTTLELQKIVNDLLKTHTITQVKALNCCLNSCYKYAISINKATTNPVKGILYPKNINVEEARTNYISEIEQKRLIKTLENDKMQGIILIALMCGLRLGEAMALTEKDINFNDSTININKSVRNAWTGERNKKGKKTREFEVTIPKTKASIREVPLPGMLVPILKSTILKNKENKIKLGECYYDGGLIFCNENGTYIDSKKPTRHLKAALKKAGIDTDLHYHSLRHIFITNCISKDIPIKTVMDWVGHSDIKMTMLVYAEINKDKNKKEYEKINSMFD